MAEESLRMFYEKARHHGMAWALKRTFFVLMRKVFRYDDSTLILYQIDGQLMPPIPAKIDGITCCWVPEKDKDQILALKDAQLNDELLNDHFRKNGRCLGAYLDGRLIGYIWVFFRFFHFPFFDYTVQLKNNEVYCGINYVIPEYRGNMIQSALFSELCRLLLEENYRFGFGSVIKDNLSSRRGVEKAGPQAYYSIRVKKLFNRIISKTETAIS
ncbi:MAG: GNAT family N-acetyltransferase [Proteobacteria bacterium]|nr:GNAT family N-acetyltransferase [Pseudomonadota bacterium]